MNPEPLNTVIPDFGMALDPALLMPSTSLPAGLMPQAEAPKFKDWLAQTTPMMETTGKVETLPVAFKVAEEKGKAVSEQLQNISAESFKTVGSVLSSLGGIIGACGPVCAHALLGNVAGSGFSAPLGEGLFGKEGTNSSGYNNPSNTDVTDFLKQLNNPEVSAFVDKYGWEALVQQVLGFMGEGVGFMFGFGLVENVISMAFDSFLPSHSSSQLAA